MDLAYIVAPLLLIAVVLGAVWLDRWSVPAILVAIGAGIVFGSDVLNLWHFDDVLLTNQVANMALVFILFHGGLVTERAELRRVALPAVGLATWGVALTAAASFVCLRFALGWSFERALLLAVIVSSTDTAAIFSILRVRALPERLGSVVKVESAANDPMAVLLTTGAVAALASGEHDASAMVLSFLWKFAVGPAIGIVVGAVSVWLFNKLTLQV
ncbi:MAG: cation:proton antiporter, partial [Sandaracinaceae bacterium]|nr:cation:proton antiporter [Sandaracinaceae bacterium]